MRTFTPTLARKNFFQIPNIILNDSEEVIITFKEGSVSVIDTKELERLKETVYVLQDPVVISQLKDLKNVPRRPFSPNEEDELDD